MKLRRIMPRSKRGDIKIVFIIIVLIFMGAIVSVIFHYVFNKMSPLVGEKLEDVPMGLGINVTGSGGVLGRAERATNALDYVFIFIFAGSLFGIIVTSFLVRTHPVFFVAYFIIAAIAILVAVPLSNAYEEFEQVSTLSETFTHFRMTSHAMRNLPLYTMITIVISIVVIYAKRQPEGYAA